MTVTRNAMHVDAFGRSVDIGDLVATTYGNYTNLVLSEVVSFTPRGFQVRPFDKCQPFRGYDVDGYPRPMGTSPKSSERIVLVMARSERELPTPEYLNIQFVRDENGIQIDGGGYVNNRTGEKLYV